MHLSAPNFGKIVRPAGAIVSPRKIGAQESHSNPRWPPSNQNGTNGPFSNGFERQIDSRVVEIIMITFISDIMKKVSIPTYPLTNRSLQLK